MANVYLQDSTLTAIGDAIRTKAGNSTLLLPSEMPAAITNLPSGGGLETVKFPYYGTNASGIVYRYDNGYTYQSFTNSDNWPYIILQNIGLDRATFFSHCPYMSFTGKLQFYDYKGTSITYDRKVRYGAWPILAQFIEWPYEVIAAVKATYPDYDAKQIIPVAGAAVTTTTASASATPFFINPNWAGSNNYGGNPTVGLVWKSGSHDVFQLFNVNQNSIKAKHSTDYPMWRPSEYLYLWR